MPSLEPVLPTCIINRNFYPKQEPETQALLGIVSGLSQLLNCAWKTFGRPPSWQRHGSHVSGCVSVPGSQPRHWGVSWKGCSHKVTNGSDKSWIITEDNPKHQECCTALCLTSSCWKEWYYCYNQVMIRHKTASQVIRQKALCMALWVLDKLLPTSIQMSTSVNSCEWWFH